MIYEQPLNEQARVYLRLEYLFDQLDYHLAKEHCWDNHQAVHTILDILQIVERADLKNKLIQNLLQYHTNLVAIKDSPAVDLAEVTKLIKQLNQAIEMLQNNHQKIGQNLRQNEFLNSIQQRISTPAGTCGFNLPAYQLWLTLDPTLRREQLHHWADCYQMLKDTIRLLLRLIRNGTPFKTVKMQNAFYQSMLDPNIAYQLIRINLPDEQHLFPEISVGRYRLAIHFFELDINNHSKQNTRDFEFQIAYCKI